MNAIDAWQLENTYADLPEKFYTGIKPTPVNAPKLIIWKILMLIYQRNFIRA